MAAELSNRSTYTTGYYTEQPGEAMRLDQVQTACEILGCDPNHGIRLILQGEQPPPPPYRLPEGIIVTPPPSNDYRPVVPSFPGLAGGTGGSDEVEEPGSGASPQTPTTPNTPSTPGTPETPGSAVPESSLMGAVAVALVGLSWRKRR